MKQPRRKHVHLTLDNLPGARLTHPPAGLHRRLTAQNLAQLGGDVRREHDYYHASVRFAEEALARAADPATLSPEARKWVEDVGSLQRGTNLLDVARVEMQLNAMRDALENLRVTDCPSCREFG